MKMPGTAPSTRERQRPSVCGITATKFEGSFHASGPIVPSGAAGLGDARADAALGEGIAVAFDDAAGLPLGGLVVEGETHPAITRTTAMTAGAGFTLAIDRLCI